MIYIKRNSENEIVDIQFDAKEGYEKSSIFNEEIKSFIRNSNNAQLIKNVMSTLDLDMVRVTEDIIDVLIQKELILFTDLPEAVQNKLVFKRFLRESLNPMENLMDDDDDINF